MIRFVAAIVMIALFAAPRGALAASSSSSHLDPAAKSVLVAYVTALRDAHYADAFKLLTLTERTYFKTAGNFGSIFTADDLRIQSFRVIASRSEGALGTLALVSENIHFLDHAHQTQGSATVTVPYGLVHAGDGWAIKDPFHPWKAFRPAGIQTTVSGLRVDVRKVSFFAGRIEMLLTFTNGDPGFVSILAYLRTVLRDQYGAVYHPLATKFPALTDRRLYEGLRLAADARYTGALNFQVPAHLAPKRLTLTIAPVLRDGADAPFEVDLPPIDVPSTP
jgi:hypothetical protein